MSPVMDEIDQILRKEFPETLKEELAAWDKFLEDYLTFFAQVEATDDGLWKVRHGYTVQQRE